MKSLKVVFLLSAVLLFLLLPSEILQGDVRRATVTIDSQKEVAVTVYNQNLGLVKDRRVLTLSKGMTHLEFMDVASGIDPTTVHIRSLTNPDALAVHEQNYEYDLLSPEKLLEKYVGKEVKLYEINPETGAENEVSATILSTQGGLVYKTKRGITYRPSKGGLDVYQRWFFPGLPENLISEPTLVWLLESGMKGNQDIEVSYLTSGINWKADYVGLLNEDDTSMDISGWVTIDNKSGATYNNARLKLVAGEIHRAESRALYREKRAQDLSYAAGRPQFEEKAFFEYHLYTLDRKTTIKENQTKQMTLFDAPGVTITKEYIFKGGGYYYGRSVEPVKDKVGVYLKIDNKKAAGMGLPLPAGIVRVYKEDTDGSIQFLGEDRLDHTPVDETFEVKIGNAFDIVAERTQTDYRKIAERVYESAYEIVVRNHKKTGIRVNVLETIPGDWQILESSHKYEKKKSNQVKFLVSVSAGKEAKLTYKVRIK
jgi:hypothetical protein